MNSRIGRVERWVELYPVVAEPRDSAPFRWLWSFVVFWLLACSSGPSDHSASERAGAGTVSDPNWCATQAVLQAKCQRCHQAPPLHGAPFSLLTYADTQVLDNKGKARFEQISSAVSSGLMPAVFIALTPPVEPLTPDERATLLDWCAAGAPLNGSEACPAAM